MERFCLKGSKRFKLKDRKGMTLIELMVSIVLLSFLVMSMVGVSGLKVKSQLDITKQYSLIAVDGVISDINQDFYRASNCKISKEGAITSLVFDKGVNGATMYQFDEGSSEFFKDGNKQFKCERFTVLSAGNSLFLTLKVEGERLLELNLYK